MTDHDDRKATPEYQAGHQAFNDGKHAGANPYAEGTPAFELWSDGHYYAAETYDLKRSRRIGGPSTFHDPYREHRTHGIFGTRF